MVFESLGLPTWQLAVLAGLLLLFLIAGGVVTWIVLNRYYWPFKVTIMEAVGNQTPKITRRTRAKLIAFGDGGEEIFQIKRPRKLRAAYGKRIGLREILWVIGEDGLWRNTDFGNFNRKIKEIGLLPIDRDIRLSNSSIRKGIETSYGTKSFLEKYGTIVTYSLFFIMILAFIGAMWFMFDQQKDISSSNLAAAETSERVLEAAASVVNSLANVQTGGSGFVPAT